MHTVPREVHGSFEARSQGNMNVTCVDGMMFVCTSGEDVYITREQAAAFFGLVEPPQKTVSKPSQPIVDCSLELDPEEAKKMWGILRYLQPVSTGETFHIVNNTYSYDGKLYEVLWEIGGNIEEPLSISVIGRNHEKV